MKKSAGLLVYRRRCGKVEVFLVHPGGPFWARRDAGAWSIPKGEFQDDEEPRAAARREFEEETGLTLDGTFVPLVPVQQSRGKILYAWAIEAEIEPTSVQSNSFIIEWPPRSGKQQEFPEIDRACWFPLEVARQKILKGQAPLLTQMEGLLCARQSCGSRCSD